MKHWMRFMLLMMLLAAVLFMAGTMNVSAAADEEDDDYNDDYYKGAYGEDWVNPEPLEEDTALAHWGAVMTANMQASAFTLAADEEDATRKWELLDMASVYTLNPIRILRVVLTEEQAEVLKTAYGINSMNDAALTLGDQLNADYELYAEAAHEISYSKTAFDYELMQEYERKPIGPFLMFFTYCKEFGNRASSHIVMFSGDDDGIGACFVISSKDSAYALDESFIASYAEALGITELETRLYSGTEPSWIMGWNQEDPISEEVYTDWGSRSCFASDDYIHALANSQELMELTFEAMSEGIGSPNFCANVLSEFMYYPKDLDAARYVSGDLLEKVRWEEEFGYSIVYNYIYRYGSVYLDLFTEGEQPEIIGSDSWDIEGDFYDDDSEAEEEEDDAILKPASVDWNYGRFPQDAKVLIIFHRYVEDQFDEMGIDWLLQAAVPFAHMPETLDGLDYIIYCDVSYDGNSYKQGNLELVYPYTHITVHNAKTGNLVKDLGTVIRTLSGYTTVTSTITYWDPLRIHIWNEIKDLFPVQIEETDDSFDIDD